MSRRDTNIESLIIDRAAAAEIPSDEAVREWAHGRRGFISSVMAELPAERKATNDAIREVGGTPVMFELFGGRDADVVVDWIDCTRTNLLRPDQVNRASLPREILSPRRASLRDARASDEIIRPLAELVLVDAVVGSGRAVRILKFKLGSPISGLRQLVLNWEPPERYSNERAATRTIQGEVRL